MRRLVVAAAIVGALALSTPQAGALAAPDRADFVSWFDPDGEPCTGVPNQISGIFDFSTACQAHDDCIGDDAGCDLAFRSDMLALCAAQHPGPLDPRRFACQAFAWLYYGGVVAFRPFV